MNSWCRWLLHAAADHLAFEHIEGREQRGRAVAFVVVSHCAGAALLHRKTRLGAVQRLNLALLIERKYDGVSRRVNVEPYDIA